MSVIQAAGQTITEASAVELEAVCSHLEELVDRLGSFHVGGAQVHRMANVRHLLMGEAFRVRMIVRELRGGEDRVESQDFDEDLRRD